MADLSGVAIKPTWLSGAGDGGFGLKGCCVCSFVTIFECCRIKNPAKRVCGGDCVPRVPLRKQVFSLHPELFLFDPIRGAWSYLFYQLVLSTMQVAEGFRFFIEIVSKPPDTKPPVRYSINTS